MGLVTTYVLAVIIGSAGVTTWWGGAVTGAVVWIAIGALTSANTILHEDRPVGLWLLFSSYQLVVLTIAGVLFVYLLGFVMGLVTTYVLAVIIGSAGVTTWWGGVTGDALTSANTLEIGRSACGCCSVPTSSWC